MLQDGIPHMGVMRKIVGCCFGANEPTKTTRDSAMKIEQNNQGRAVVTKAAKGEHPATQEWHQPLIFAMFTSPSSGDHYLAGGSAEIDSTNPGVSDPALHELEYHPRQPKDNLLDGEAAVPQHW